MSELKNYLKELIDAKDPKAVRGRNLSHVACQRGLTQEHKENGEIWYTPTDKAYVVIGTTKAGWQEFKEREAKQAADLAATAKIIKAREAKKKGGF